MSREIRRVPLDFQWPLKKVWEGYLHPGKFDETPCPDCERGYSTHASYLQNLWYGYVPFDPASTGSQSLEIDTPAVRAFAERNVSQAPEFYGTGEHAIKREARRLADLWNGQWCHHLAQADVDVLVAADRLRDFTHTWARGVGWTKIEPPITPTAAEVNIWSLGGFGHDSINQGVAVEAKCERDGQPYTCSSCDGHGSFEAYAGQREESEAWERVEPPLGEGWQVWETTSEGSPISPVFAARDEVIAFLMSDQYFGFGTSPTPLTRDQAEAFVGAGYSMGSMVVAGGMMINGDAAIHELGAQS